MKIGGLQKLSLLDFPDRLAATVFLNGCNFRCPFCHNRGLVIPSELEENFSLDDVFSFLETRKGKLDGICITGGEPLLNNDLEDLILPVREMGFLVKLDTNGSFPEKLGMLISSGLIDYVAMDIKNSKEKYPLTTGCPDIDMGAVLESVSILMENTIDYEFRTTVVKELHGRDDLMEIGMWLKGAKNYYLQTFVDSGSLVSNEKMHGYKPDEMQEFASMLSGFFGHVDVRG